MTRRHRCCCCCCCCASECSDDSGHKKSDDVPDNNKPDDNKKKNKGDDENKKEKEDDERNKKWPNDPKHPRPIKLRNIMHLNEDYDSLHKGDVTYAKTLCSEAVCLASIMGIAGRGDIPRTPDECFHEADTFLKQYYSSVNKENSAAHLKRLAEVKKEIYETGAYEIKLSELVYGSKMAWRNAQRCIGRIQWKKLQVFDCREVTTARGMFEALCTHIKYGTNKGNIRSAITIFKQRTDGKHDYKIWNPQLLGYAGYKQPDGTILGDPGRVEFTDVCIKLGWKPPRTEWDILPLVLSADGKDPEVFDIPRKIVLEVQLEHPKYEWFKDLGLRWYVMPAVANMRLDCGGLEFTAAAFNGWYMSTEIGCRNLCDSGRRNMLKPVAEKMGLDTSSNLSLWKDKALVEINLAVVHSFVKQNVSLVDHHTASEQFMQHLDTENKTRGGCPSDWNWVVPPMSASITDVFHQEMALYYIRPSYDYQEFAWNLYKWDKDEDSNKPRKKFSFKQIALTVKLTSKLFKNALSKRIKATILYASETGKSERYAKDLGLIFGHAFNTQVQCMSEYDMVSIEHETLLLVVTSTFGNGEPPTNGVEFADHLFKMLYKEKGTDQIGAPDSPGPPKMPTPRSLMRTNSMMTPSNEYKRQLTRLESNKSTGSVRSTADGPLNNVSFAVFALGSSAYPKFCNFGKTVDKVLHDLGGERILEVGLGDEMYGQEQSFRDWATEIFKVACDRFCLDENEGKRAITELPLTEETVKFAKVAKAIPLKKALEFHTKKELVKCVVIDNINLGDNTDDKMTIFVNMEPEVKMKYDPGDHLGVIPCNRKEIVDAVLARCKDVDDSDKPVQLQLLKENLTPTSVVKVWENHDRIQAVTPRNMFTRFLDITTPPSTKILKYLLQICTDQTEKDKLNELITQPNKYDDWRNFDYPHLGEVLAMFPSCKPKAALLAALLPQLQTKYYSVSSSPLAHGKSIHLTVSVVVYKTQKGKGVKHYGVCSNYLKDSVKGHELLVFMQSASSFHMPEDITTPLVLVGPGSGIAPFRGFWHHRYAQKKSITPNMKQPGQMWLFFGCRTRGMDLYKQEKQQMVQEGILTKSLLALSREPNEKTQHVQDLLEKEGANITRLLLEEGGHFYVCGDCKMAEDVQQRLKSLLKKYANMSTEEVDDYILELMDENRYHEDIFGITLRTSEVHYESVEKALRQRVSSVSEH